MDFGFDVPSNPLYASPDAANALLQRYKGTNSFMDHYLENKAQQMANDIWGLGVLLYYMLTGYHLVIYDKPQNSEMPKLDIWYQLSQLNSTSDISFPEPSKFRLPAIHKADKWKHMIANILVIKWEERPTAGEIVDHYQKYIL